MTNSQKLIAFLERASSQEYKNRYSESYIQKIVLNYKLNIIIETYERPLKNNLKTHKCNNSHDNDNRFFRLYGLDNLGSESNG